MTLIDKSARTLVHVLGLLVVSLVIASTLWTVDRDREIMLRNAGVQLEDVAVVLSDQTRVGLSSAQPSIRDTALGKDNRAPDAAFQHYIASLYDELKLGYEGRIGLFRLDGTLVAGHPEVADALGRRFDAYPLFADALKRSKSGAITSRGFIDSNERIIGYRQVDGYPLVVVVSTSKRTLLAPWRDNTMRAALVAAVFAALAIIGTFLLSRQLRVSEDLARELHESASRLQSIINSAMDAIITIDDQQNIIMFNGAAEKIFGCPAVEAIGSQLSRFIPQRYRAAHQDHVQRFGQAGVTVRRMGGEFVLAGVRSDGEEFPIDASISHVTVGGRKFYTVILRDITERQRSAEALQRSHEELRELYEGMHQVREAERTRIARELHDELAQWLTALKMDAAWIASRFPDKDDPLAKKAERMKGVVDNTVAAMRRIAADLRPVMLDDLGLVPAIENLLFDLSERTGMVVSLTGNTDDLNLKDPLATAVYRMVQEALTNVARHSGARSVDVHIEFDSDRLQISVRDDGRGLRPDPNRKSFGLVGIRERARTLGGSARIHSPESGGTVVEIEVPVALYSTAGAAS